MKVVLDVNVLVSSMIAPEGLPRAIVDAWRERAFDLVISEGMLAVTEEKLRQPRIRTRYRVIDTDIQTTLGLFRSEGTLVRVLAASVGPITGDPEDDYVLATAVAGQADYLVTGDHGLQALDTHEGVAIVSPRQFIDLLRGAS